MGKEWKEGEKKHVKRNLLLVLKTVPKCCLRDVFNTETGAWPLGDHIQAIDRQSWFWISHEMTRISPEFCVTSLYINYCSYICGKI